LGVPFTFIGEPGKFLTSLSRDIVKFTDEQAARTIFLLGPDIILDGTNLLFVFSSQFAGNGRAFGFNFAQAGSHDRICHSFSAFLARFGSKQWLFGEKEVVGSFYFNYFVCRKRRVSSNFCPWPVWEFD